MERWMRSCAAIVRNSRKDRKSHPSSLNTVPRLARPFTAYRTYSSSMKYSCLIPLGGRLSANSWIASSSL